MTADVFLVDPVISLISPFTSHCFLPKLKVQHVLYTTTHQLPPAEQKDHSCIFKQLPSSCTPHAGSFIHQATRRGRTAASTLQLRKFTALSFCVVPEHIFFFLHPLLILSSSEMVKGESSIIFKCSRVPQRDLHLYNL